MTDNMVKIEVSGERYINFTNSELHFSEEYGVMEPISNIVATELKSNGMRNIIASKDKYSVIDLVAGATLPRNGLQWAGRLVKSRLKEYNNRVYNKNSPYVLVDSSEYIYQSTIDDGSNFSLRNSYINKVKRQSIETGGYNYGLNSPNYPNIWKESGRICEGNASITTGTNTAEHGLKKMVHNFFTTQFNNDLTGVSVERRYFLKEPVLMYYLDRRVEQLGLEGQDAEDFRELVIEHNRNSRDTVYSAMYFFSVLGVDYANIY